MAKSKEADSKVEKSETAEIKPASVVDVVAVPAAVTEVLKKVKEETEGKNTSIFEEPPKEEIKPEGEEPEGKGPAVKADIKPKKAEGEELEAKPQEYLEEIDPRLVDAAHAADLTDEEIEKFAADNWNLFVKTFTPKTPVKKEEIPPVGDTKPLSKIKLDAETTQKWVDAYGQDAVDSAIKPLAETLNATIDQLAEVRAGLGKVQGRFTEQDKQVEGQRQAAKIQHANTIFDEESKNYPELGTTEKLSTTDTVSGKRVITTSPEFKTRSEIYGIAEVFHTAGVSWPTSMKQAMTWYAGKVGEKRVEQRLISDINKDKKRWVARPDQKKVEREFASPDEKKKAIVQGAYKAAGITV